VVDDFLIQPGRVEVKAIAIVSQSAQADQLVGPEYNPQQASWVSLILATAIAIAIMIRTNNFLEALWSKASRKLSFN
jgi:hypothetical protein